MGEPDHTFGLVPVSSVPPSEYEYRAVVNVFYPDVADPSRTSTATSSGCTPSSRAGSA